MMPLNVAATSAKVSCATSNEKGSFAPCGHQDQQLQLHLIVSLTDDPNIVLTRRWS
jgi:hypothetical protein